MKFLLVVFLALAICWSYIFFSGTGVLIHSSKVKTQINSVEMLHCKYFTGTSIIEKKFPFTNNSIIGSVGKSICERTIKL